MSEAIVPSIEIGRISAARIGLVGRLLERRWVFVTVFLLTLAAAGGAFTLLPATYRATATVIVAVQESGTTDASAAWVEKLGDPADLESQLLLVKSPRLLRELLARPQVAAALREDCEATAAQPGIGALIREVEPQTSCGDMLADIGKTVSWMQDHLVVGSVGRSRVIAVSYGSPSPAVARTMANELVQIYLDDGRKQKLETRAAAVDWVHQQLAQLAVELHQDDVTLQNYRREHGLVRGQVAPITSESLTATAHLLAAAQATKAEAYSRLLEMSSDQKRDARSNARSVLEFANGIRSEVAA